jgi:hypothetical protein
MRITEKIIAHNKNFAGTPPVLMAFLGDSVTHGCFEVYVAANGGLDYNAFNRISIVGCLGGKNGLRHRFPAQRFPG